MLRRSALLFLVLCLGASSGISQSLQEFKYLGDDYADYLYLGLMVKRTSIKNPGAPREEVHDISGITGDISIRSANFSKGGFRYSMNYKLLSDLIFILENQVNEDGKKYYRQESSGLTNGIIGWHSFGWNLHSGNLVNVAVGFNCNDYFISTSYFYEDSTGTGLVSNEPQGWYLATGPSLFADFLLTKYTILHLQTDYSIPYTKPVSLSYGIEDPDYPFPHVYHFSAELVSPFGVYIGGDYARVVNRGALHNNTRRLDLYLGFRFVL